MASPSDAHSATGGSGAAAAARSDLGDFLEKLDLNDDDFADVEIDEDDPEIQESVRWLALARVHTNRNFSPSAFYKDMRAAWNPAQEIRFRPVGPNRFVVQACCLGDWDRMMKQGPWLFRNMAVLLCPYDGFNKTEEVKFFHIPIWLQIHKLPDPYCKQNIVEKLLKDAGEIMEMRLNGNTRGDYGRVRVRHDIRKPLTKYVSIVRAKERQVYLVRYEKLARFCKFCGLIGHDHKECGLGIHEEKDLKFGEWIYADAPNKPRQEERTTKPTGYAPMKADDKVPGSSKPQYAPYDAEVLDTATSPIKKTSVRADGVLAPKRRLDLEEAGKPLGDGSGVPKTINSSSKRLKVNTVSDNNERSAASLEEDRRTQ
ncbi:hypothetical protein VPH35_054318 [Triticum aestivum]